MLFRVTKKYGGFEKHPLYIELYKLHSKNVASLDYFLEHPGVTEFGPVPPNMPPAVYKPPETKQETAPLPDATPAQSNPPVEQNKVNSVPSPTQVPEQTAKPAEPPKPTEPAKSSSESSEIEKEQPKLDEDALAKKKSKKCDEILAEYLDSVAKLVNKECYKQVVKFMFLFRECLNHFGERLSKSKLEQGINMASPSNSKPDEEFCLTNNAEQAPEISNEFVTIYLDDLKTGFGRLDAIELTQNFCSWLFNNGYTCSKLSLIQDSPQ